ncbi:MAG: aminomethyl-transferring glycine dehydrogenase subunit GcvPA [Eubacteriales bacterium]|nr:aminomethyl-transferring glycine dehydrogenase subunit GcvPA [Eubacteriales bacterium]
MSGFTSIQPQDRQAMLASVGIDNPDALFAPIPAEFRWPTGDADPYTEPAMSELEVTLRLQQLASRNINTTTHACFLGAGAYDHYIPAAIDALVSRQEFLTAYTPYQPEISQGTLQAIFEFQSLICRLTGLEISNSSMYDGASAAAEAMLMTIRQTGRTKILLIGAIHPHTSDVVHTYLEAQNFVVDVLEATAISQSAGTTSFVKSPLVTQFAPPDHLDLTPYAGILLQRPDFFGRVGDIEAWTKAAHSAGALAVLSCDPISLALLKTPGEMGFDIAVGDAQPLGNPLAFGGPYIGFLATRESLLRKMPGRIVGETIDHEGRRCFVLTIQAREQHIRREKATSNICTSQALVALRATIYLSLQGQSGFVDVAEQSAAKAVYLQQHLLATGHFAAIDDTPFFREFAVRVISQSSAYRDVLQRLNQFLLTRGFLGGLDLGQPGTTHSILDLPGVWLLAVTEKRTKAEMDALVVACSDFFEQTHARQLTNPIPKGGGGDQ